MFELYIFLLTVSTVGAFECDQHAKICETSLDISYKLPMVNEDGSVYPYNGNLYQYNVTDPVNSTPVDITDIISADGWENSFKLIVSVNGTLPGPSIIVYEGQLLLFV